MSDQLCEEFQKMNTDGRRGISRSSIPKNPVISNLNGLLSDIYVRYTAVINEDFELYYSVFSVIFDTIHKTMKEVDPYYNRYSSTVQFAGSHPDRLRIKKPDEFDMTLCIGLPVNIKGNPWNPYESDIVLQPQATDFVQLRMGVQFQRLDQRDGDEERIINKTAHEWEDNKHYLLRSKFIEWFRGVVNAALNELKGNKKIDFPLVLRVNGVDYTVSATAKDVAVTLLIENEPRKFQLEVDLVPALMFPEGRWPVTRRYRKIPPECSLGMSNQGVWVEGVWTVVPKTNHAGHTIQDKARSWRVTLNDQERMLMYNSHNMRLIIQLIKKLRDALGMEEITSYYIKTLFFWENENKRKHPFWQKSHGELFIFMVEKLHAAIVAGRIPYYWEKKQNLLRGVPRSTLNRYAVQLSQLLQVLRQPTQYKQVAKYLLTPEELEEYNQKFLRI